jgi:hypothetical protein
LRIRDTPQRGQAATKLLLVLVLVLDRFGFDYENEDDDEDEDICAARDDSKGY